MAWVLGGRGWNKVSLLLLLLLLLAGTQAFHVCVFDFLFLSLQ